MNIDTIAGAVVCVIILGILVGEKVVASDAAAVQFAIIIVTNIVYECFLMFLLGYGLVELPRRVWLYSNIKYALLRTQCKASSDFKDISDSSITVSEIVRDVHKTKEVVRAASHLFM
jgi:ABC-type uncharacterized transport system permease subunit